MLLQKLCCRAPSKQKQIMRRDTGYSRFYAERSVLYIIRHRILVAALASLASRCNQASLRLAKGWIAFTNGIFDSREPPIWVPVAARPQDSRYAWPKSKLRPQLYNIPQEIPGIGRQGWSRNFWENDHVDGLAKLAHELWDKEIRVIKKFFT